MSCQSFFVTKWPSHDEDKVYDIRLNTVSQIKLLLAHVYSTAVAILYGHHHRYIVAIIYETRKHDRLLYINNGRPLWPPSRIMINKLIYIIIITLTPNPWHHGFMPACTLPQRRRWTRLRRFYSTTNTHTSSSSSSSSTTVGSMPVGVWRHSYYRCPPLPI